MKFEVGQTVRCSRTLEKFTIQYIKEGKKYKYGYDSGDHETTRNRGNTLELIDD